MTEQPLTLEQQDQAAESAATFYLGLRFAMSLLLSFATEEVWDTTVQQAREQAAAWGPEGAAIAASGVLSGACAHMTFRDDFLLSLRAEGAEQIMQRALGGEDPPPR